MTRAHQAAASTADSFPERMKSYREGRARFPAEELMRYAGQWVAFSVDGRRILASGGTHGEAEEALRQAGLDPQEAVFSFLPDDDTQYGGAELG